MIRMRAAITLREAVETLAWEVLARAAVTRPPVDIDAVAAGEGLGYRPIAFRECLGAYVRNGFPGAGPSWARQSFAFIGMHQHPLRQRFTKAHELAHHLMDDGRVDWVARMRLPLPRRYEGNVYHEAHELFAASLLMPRRWVEGFDGGSWRRGDVASLARHFAVTKIAAAVRLDELLRSRHDIEPAPVPAGELTGLYAQA